VARAAAEVAAVAGFGMGWLRVLMAKPEAVNLVLA
jgi:hypothetical protein